MPSPPFNIKDGEYQTVDVRVHFLERQFQVGHVKRVHISQHTTLEQAAAKHCTLSLFQARGASTL